MDKLKGWLLDFWCGIRILFVIFGIAFVFVAGMLLIVTYPISVVPTLIFIVIFFAFIIGRAERKARW